MMLENRLGQSDSPYLKEAAGQPVHWQTYSEEVFKIASELDRPILLDIGAVWCHWCHVMDEESYSDMEVAQLINDHFVPVKVDRDQMPDVDARYQAAIGALTGTGGWPLTGFLTPDGKVFYGGTYFPKKDVDGRPGMLDLLPQVAEVFHKRRSELLRSAEDLYKQLNEFESGTLQGGQISEAIINDVISDARRRFDEKFGGFGSGPKFFNPCLLELLIDENKQPKDPVIHKMVDLTLRGISTGGVFDQIGGGFHRYSVDGYWHVPHFEKMLYDNALLLKVYSDFFEVTQETFYRDIATRTADWLIGEMQSDTGGFYAHQDADVGSHDDGSYWTWTKAEVESILTPEEFKIAENYFDIRDMPEDINGFPDRNVLRVAMNGSEVAAAVGISVEKSRELIASTKTKLSEVRNKRNTPFIDRTIFADRNGLAITGLVAASLSLREKKYLESAEKAAEFILDNMVDPNGRVSHSSSISSDTGYGLLEDHAYLGLALLDLFEITRNDRYLYTSELIANTLIDKFEDKRVDGFFDRPSDREGVGLLKNVRKPIEDSPTPAGNSIAAILFDRLCSITENKNYSEVAGRTLNAFAGSAGRLGIFGASYASGVRLHLRMI